MARKIIDFGIALDQKNDTRESKARGMEGTPPYMAPELFADGTRSAPTADIYSLGATLYEALTGKVPYRGAVHMLIKQKSAPVTPPRVLDDRIPADLESICLKALSFEPEDRYQTARDFAEDLKRFLGGEPTLARPLSTPQRLLRWSARHKALSAAAASILALIGVLSIGSIAVAAVLWQKNLAIAQQRERARQALEARLVTAGPDSLLLAVEQFRNSAEQPVAQLKQLQSAHLDSRARLNTACALAVLGEPTQAEILGLLPTVARTRDQSKAIATALAAAPEKSLELIRDSYQSVTLPEQIKLATLAWYLGDASELRSLADAGRSADARTQLIHGLADWCPNLDLAISQSLNTGEPDLAACFMLGLGLMDDRLLSDEQRTALRKGVLSLIDDKACPAQLSASASWLARTSPWIEYVEDASDGLPFRMLHIHPGSFMMGESDPANMFNSRTAHPVEITRPYLLSDREVSVGFFRQVLGDSQDPEYRRLVADWEPDEVISPTDCASGSAGKLV